MPGYGFDSSKAAKGRNSGVLGSITAGMQYVIYIALFMVKKQSYLEWSRWRIVLNVVMEQTEKSGSGL